MLKRYRAHHGVDYAAPIGTPVKSIGDGRVVAKGYQPRGGGYYLKVKHNSVYTTTYMHLSRYAKGINKGTRVQQGQVIAYVGSTGLSTGPHLDFRVQKNGSYINPSPWKPRPTSPARGAARQLQRGEGATAGGNRHLSCRPCIPPRRTVRRWTCRGTWRASLGYDMMRGNFIPLRCGRGRPAS